MDQVEIDEEQVRLARRLPHHVPVPKLLDQRPGHDRQA
jgi:hypothetical protein